METKCENCGEFKKDVKYITEVGEFLCLMCRGE